MRKLLVLVMAAVMFLSLAGCGASVPAEKIGKVDSLIAKMEVLVEDTLKEVEKTNKTGYEDVQKYYDTNIAVVNEVKAVFAQIKTAWAQNKSKMDEQQVDTAIAELEKLEKQCQEMKQNAIDEVKMIGEAITESEKIVDAALKGALADVEIYEVPEIAATSWEFMGSIADGEEIDEAGRQEVLAAFGDKIQLIFPDKTKVSFVTGQGKVDGTYTVDSTNDIVVVSLSNGTVYSCVFTLSNNIPVMIALIDDTANNAFYFTQIQK